MTILYAMSEAEAAEHAEWVRTRPEVVRKIAERLPPNKLYRLKTTGQRVTLYSIGENGTVTVNITGEFNLIDFDRQVFGINPDDLEECDLPAPDEPVGTLVKNEQLQRYVDVIRPFVLAARTANPDDPYGKDRH